MNTNGGKQMNGLTISGLSLAVIGILVIIWGTTKVSVNLAKPDFMSFATGGLILLAIGLCMVPQLSFIYQIVGIWLAAVAIMAYIYSLPNMDFIVMAISFIGTIALALWISFKFWK